ncbi:MAG: carboxypeptidase regulatory-like domain-containing protein [Planctomycetes bacterium]|nr:carboxypeptidase regulatory-like domain-containing protein [Planctomycetota bacterium]MCC7170340.1 carboxypeptidase regulatory-like domain-containing protein [Planctomycetota bacterium]
MFRILIVTSLIAGCGVLAWLWLASDLDAPTAAAAMRALPAIPFESTHSPALDDESVQPASAKEPEAALVAPSEPKRTAATTPPLNTVTRHVRNAPSELSLLLAGRVGVADGSSAAGAIVTVSTAASWPKGGKHRKARSWTTTVRDDGSFRIQANDAKETNGASEALRVAVALRDLRLGPLPAQRGNADTVLTLPATAWVHGRLRCNRDVDPGALRILVSYEVETADARVAHHVVSRAPTRDGRFGIEVPADRACTLIVGSERPGTAFVTIPDVGREPVERARSSSASDPRLAPIDLRHLAFAFSGRVDSTRGEPIRNATIRTSNAITKSAAQGRFTLVLPPGPVKLLVSAAGYDGVQIPVATPGVVVRLEPTRSR